MSTQRISSISSQPLQYKIDHYWTNVISYPMPWGCFSLCILCHLPSHATDLSPQSNSINNATWLKMSLDLLPDLAMKWALTYSFPKRCALLLRDSRLTAHTPLCWTSSSYRTSLWTSSHCPGHTPSFSGSPHYFLVDINFKFYITGLGSGVVGRYSKERRAFYFFQQFPSSCPSGF